MPKATIVLYWRDDSKKRAQTSLRYRYATARARGGISGISELADAAQQLSSAQLYEIRETYEYRGLGIRDEPEPGASVWRKLIVLCTNGTDWASICIPSPRLDLPYDVVGVYKGWRISRETVQLSGVFSGLDSVSRDTITPAGDEWPGPAIVAGLDRVTV